MRTPSDMPQKARPALTRRRRWIIVGVIVAIILIASLRTFAIFYTDALWFSSVNLHSVWVKLFEIKVGLMVVFAAVFAILLLASLLVAERLAPKGPSLDAEDEFVKRYQEIIGPYSRWLRAGVVVVLSLIVGSQAIGQWNNWILFRHSTAFHATDPQFHRNVGYFVFTLPFEQFLVHWMLVALVVVLLVTVLTHYLNGGIRLQGPRPRVRPAVKAHISVILGLLALVKAVGYYLARFTLDLSSNGYNQGADYTDIHARLPALELLILVSLAAAVLLIYNIRRQGWALPILGVGLWFLVALTAGTIYPAAVQALKVNPAQNTLERPYIQRNIDATRAAMGIDNVQSTPYQANSNLSAAQLSLNSDTLANVRLWDPTQTGSTYDKLQDLRSYYQFNSLAIDRYKVGATDTPVVVGVREVNDADLPSTSWVNTTLQYTHGYGMIISPANSVCSGDSSCSGAGDPTFGVGQVPPASQAGYPKVTQPSVYFGLDNSGYVVANTKQPEIDFQLTNGQNVETHYKGDGGVQLSNFFRQAMFAIRFSDLNLIISNQITNDSRLMFDRGVQARVSKAAPFLSLDADPYPVLLDGRIEWVQDAYTTSDNYPYAQNADTSALPTGSGLNQNLNYVRNSVKVLIDAYTGKMTFYVMDPHDPIIQTYEKAFPGMFTPASRMSSALRAHLRYPEDIFTLQATMYGKYHITNAQSFYSAADAWTSDHADHQRPGPDRVDRPAGADGADLPGVAGARSDPAVLHPAGRLRAGVGAEPDPDPVRLHDRRQRPRSVRQAGDVRHAAGQPGQRPLHRGRPDRRQLRRLPPDQPAQPERVVGPAGQRPHDSGGQLPVVHPAALRRIVEEPLPGAPRGHRRLPEPGGHRLDALRGPLPGLLRPHLGDPGRHRDDRDALAPGAQSSERRPAGLRAVPGGPEGRKSGCLPDRHPDAGVEPAGGPAADRGDRRPDQFDHHDHHQPVGHRSGKGRRRSGPRRLGWTVSAPKVVSCRLTTRGGAVW